MSGGALDWIAGRGTTPDASLRVPGDKSVSHRAVMLGAIAEGTTEVEGFLEGEDTRATAAVFSALGVRIEAPAPSRRIVHGVGLHGLRASPGALDCGNAGTGMRLLAGLLAGQPFASTLVGDASLSARPMARVVEPLARMGARIETAPGGRPPLRIAPAPAGLVGIDYALPVASAQVKSALLLAGLQARGTTTVREPHPTRDYTERMLQAFGWPIRFRAGEASLEGGHALRATRVEVPADPSSAAFFLVLGAIVPGAHLRLERVGMNPRRIGLLHALRAMGADIREEAPGLHGGEPVADLVVRHAPLRGVTVDEAWVPDMIDEFPALFVAAAVAEGPTTITGAAELRVKESDRLAGMAAVLRAMGARVDERPDGAVIEGGARLRGAPVDSLGDHRLAMAAAVAAQVAGGELRIRDVANVATSFPGFLALAGAAGMGLREAAAG